MDRRTIYALRLLVSLVLTTPVVVFVRRTAADQGDPLPLVLLGGFAVAVTIAILMWLTGLVAHRLLGSR